MPPIHPPTVSSPRRLLAAAALLGASLFAACGGSEPELCAEPLELETLALRTDGQLFLDAADRQVLLRGVNAGGRSKFPPYFPFPFAESGYPNQADAEPFDVELARYTQRILDWGHNVVRLPFSWEAVEPVRGSYDAVYVDRLVAMAQHASDQGLRVVLDFHQDVYARPFCGDGFPLWAISEPVPEIPDVEDCGNWFSAYLSSSSRVAQEFERFWANEDDLQDAFIDMWAHVIQATAEVDGVVAFEMMNEPFKGSIPAREWVDDILLPLFQRFADTVQEHRPGATAFIGSEGTDTLTGSTALVRPEGDNIGYAPHFYDPIIYIFSTSAGRWDPPAILDNYFQTSTSWQVPALVGEFGCRTREARCDEYLRDVYDTMDGYPLHATAWEYSATVDDWNNEGFGLVEFGGAELPAANEVVRVYPMAIAGRWGSFSFDRETLGAELSWTAEAGGITELSAPARLYPRGPSVQFEEGRGCASWDQASQRLVVRTDAAGATRIRLSAR